MRDTSLRRYALQLTAAIADGLARGDQPPPDVKVAAPFPPAFDDDERFWAAGPFTLQEFSALGDGRYEHSSVIAGGSGGLGLLTLAGTLGWSAANKRRARRRAAWDATPRWHDIDAGTVAITICGMYLHTENGFFPWGWEAVTAADLVEPGVLEFSGQSENGTVSWRLRSDWAELAFVTWAMARHPRHPRLAASDWLPHGWAASVNGSEPTCTALTDR